LQLILSKDKSAFEPTFPYLREYLVQISYKEHYDNFNITAEICQKNLEMITVVSFQIYFHIIL